LGRKSGAKLSEGCWDRFWAAAGGVERPAEASSVATSRRNAYIGTALTMVGLQFLPLDA
jgi:hypothetical protein